MQNKNGRNGKSTQMFSETKFAVRKKNINFVVKLDCLKRSSSEYMDTKRTVVAMLEPLRFSRAYRPTSLNIGSLRMNKEKLCSWQAPDANTCSFAKISVLCISSARL